MENLVPETKKGANKHNHGVGVWLSGVAASQPPRA